MAAAGIVSIVVSGGVPTAQADDLHGLPESALRSAEERDEERDSPVGWQQEESGGHKGHDGYRYEPREGEAERERPGEGEMPAAEQWEAPAPEPDPGVGEDIWPEEAPWPEEDVPEEEAPWPEEDVPEEQEDHSGQGAPPEEEAPPGVDAPPEEESAPQGGKDTEAAQTLPVTSGPLTTLALLGGIVLTAGAVLLGVARRLRYRPRHGT